MLNLALAVLSSVLVSSVMRISESYTSKEKNISMLMINYLVCILLALLYNGSTGLTVSSSGFSFCFLVGLINGFLYLMGFVLLQINVKRNGMAMSSTFMRLGVLVPTALSITLFHEKPGVLQIIGFLLAIFAIIVISSHTQAKEADTAGSDFKIGLILMLLAGGTADAMSKVYDTYGNPELSNLFLVMTFLFAFLFCILLLLFKKQSLGRNELLFGIIIAIPNYYSARFLLKAVSEVQAFVAYPTYSVATIIVSGITGVILFKEHLNKRQLFSLGCILLALILLNL